MTIELKGRIDSSNAAQVEAELFRRLADQDGAAVILDAAELEYISSAGLRMLLRIRKVYPDMQIVQVNSEVYEILDMTGFTQMMTVEKAWHVVSIEGCEEIGRGAKSAIYRIDQDKVVKVYNNADALADIKHEREVAKLALILGIPTAISYDVVKVGEHYGSVFELLNARSFSKILATEPEKMDWCVKEYVELLKKIHSTVVPPGKLPDMKEEVLSWARFMRDHLPEKAGKKLLALVEAVPHDDHMIHGDYHTKNVELQNDEVLLIDMDTLAVGHPIFELAFMFSAFVGHSEYDRENVKRFQGFDFETSSAFWHKTLSAYLQTNCETKIREVEDKARIIGYMRMIRHAIRFGDLETEAGRAEAALWEEQLLVLLEKTDTLMFEQNELVIEASDEALAEVQAFVNERLEAVGCPMKAQMQIELAVEEVFINIAHYAYGPGGGPAKLRVEISGEPAVLTLCFTDRGMPYNPLAREDPDLAAPAEERQVGGLGVYLVKKTMDDVQYAYKDGQNILTLKKTLFAN